MRLHDGPGDESSEMIRAETAAEFEGRGEALPE